MGTRKRRRWPMTLALLVSLFLLTSVALVADAWQTFGKAPEGERAATMAASPQWTGAGFENPQPLWNDISGTLTGFTRASPHGSPDGPVAIQENDGKVYRRAPKTGLRITWLGHSTLLLEVDGTTVLTDPIFGGRASPWTWMGPETWYAPPLALADLPALDAVLISHDHYDHLQIETIQALAEQVPRFIVPLGVGAHLEYWGVDPARITELDWWGSTEVGTLDLVSTPARHASGRQLLDQNRTLWTGFALVGPQHRVYYSGDTGLFPALEEIGERLGPFDVTMIEVGAYDRAWPDWHMGPEQAVRAHDMARGTLFLPVHWGLWDLALHGWTDPIERVLAAAEQRGARVALPRPGQPFEPEGRVPTEQWWPDLPWVSAEADPVVATKVPPE